MLRALLAALSMLPIASSVDAVVSYDIVPNIEDVDRRRIATQLEAENVQVVYADYLNEFEIAPRLIGADVVQIDDEWEIGAAFSTGKHRLGVGKLRWDRVGIAYRFSD